MKIVLALVSLLGFLNAGFSQVPSGQSFGDVLRRAEVIAIVSVTNVVRGNPGDRDAAVYTADATVERVLKGGPAKTLRIRDEGEASHFSYDNFSPRTELKAHTKDLGTARFLVYLKKSGGVYAASHHHGLVPVYGTGSGARATWPGCILLDEAVAGIEKNLTKE